jgi:hypothetical protein
MGMRFRRRPSVHTAGPPTGDHLQLSPTPGWAQLDAASPPNTIHVLFTRISKSPGELDWPHSVREPSLRQTRECPCDMRSKRTELAPSGHIPHSDHRRPRLTPPRAGPGSPPVPIGPAGCQNSTPRRPPWQRSSPSSAARRRQPHLRTRGVWIYLEGGHVAGRRPAALSGWLSRTGPKSPWPGHAHRPGPNASTIPFPVPA